MKITIDTKEDSHDEIRKLIKMLQHLVGENAVSNAPNIFGETSSAPSATTDAFANLFDNVQDNTPASDAGTMVQEKKEETPKIIFYD